MDDVIYRQDAIEAIRKTDGLLASMTTDGQETMLIDKALAQTELMMLPSAQQWIPCSERLPEKNGRYLVTNGAWGAMEVDWNSFIEGQWLFPNTKPVAWMPLPEPYKEGDK